MSADVGEKVKQSWADAADESSDEEIEERSPAVVIASNNDTKGGESRPRVRKEPEFPKEPPFNATVKNLDHNVTTEKLAEFFESGGCKVVNVQIVQRGQATIEFKTLDDLKESLNASGQVINDRTIKVYVFDKKYDLDNGKGGKFNKYTKNNDTTTPSWDRGFKKNYNSKDNNSGGNVAKEGVSYQRKKNDNSRPVQQQQQQQQQQQPQQNTASDVNSTTEPAKERPKIVIAPRTKPVDAIGKSVATNASIFGGAKPVDTLSYEMERMKKIGSDEGATSPTTTTTVSPPKEKTEKVFKPTNRINKNDGTSSFNNSDKIPRGEKPPMKKDAKKDVKVKKDEPVKAKKQVKVSIIYLLKLSMMKFLIFATLDTNQVVDDLLPRSMRQL